MNKKDRHQKTITERRSEKRKKDLIEAGNNKKQKTILTMFGKQNINADDVLESPVVITGEENRIFVNGEGLIVYIFTFYYLSINVDI